MSVRLKIFFGIVIWIAGLTLDVMLIPYGFLLIYIGVAWTFFEIGKWVMKKENRIRARKFGFVKIILAFWIACCVFGMILMILTNVLLKSTPSYDTAAAAIENDEEVLKRTGGIRHFSSSVGGNSSNFKTSTINTGVVGKNESFWVTVSVEATADGYRATGVEIK